MTQIEEIIQETRRTLVCVFADVDTWFEKPADLRDFRPPTNGWTINEVLEHISLTSHFLLILIDKAVTKALKNVNNLNLTQELADYHFEKEKLDEVGLYKSFEWIRPEHMDPTGQVPLVQVRETIQNQLNRCLEHLQNMPNGEGVLYKTTMTVNNLGKIDVYEYIYFLAKHAERHIAQMERNEQEFAQKQTFAQ
ncbi:MAG: DinB family protein [Cytophagales bacterium]|jgi:hypothetical protein|nr:DinB family protein [Cytophagales bacterium]